MVEVKDEEALRHLSPDLALLARIDTRGFVVTARANENQRYDYVLRLFGPRVGTAKTDEAVKKSRLTTGRDRRRASTAGSSSAAGRTSTSAPAWRRGSSPTPGGSSRRTSRTAGSRSARSCRWVKRASAASVSTNGFAARRQEPDPASTEPKDRLYETHPRSLLVANPPFGSVLAGAPKEKSPKMTLIYQHELPNVPGKSTGAYSSKHSLWSCRVLGSGRVIERSQTSETYSMR